MGVIFESIHGAKQIVKILSPAKINFGLWVKRKREDGYHDIFTIMHTIDLQDEIYIEPSYTFELFTTGPFSKNIENNIVKEAVEEFSKLTGTNFDYKIIIQKNIPVGAGLGGASSNMASVINYLNKELENPLSEEELMDFLATFSKDAPFFIKGGCAIAYGTGDKLKPINSIQKEITIIYPNVEASTKRVYDALQVEENQIELENIIELLEKYPIEDVIENHLQGVSCDIYKEIGEVVRFLESFGYKAYMSGSGSSVYVIGKLDNNIKNAILLRGWELFECKTI